MLRKLIRKEYYDKDFPLNEQEFKEFSFARLEPYWKIRAKLYFFGLNVFGDKGTLNRRIADYLFHNEVPKKPEVQESFDLDIELVVRNLKCSSGKYESIGFHQLEAKLLKDHKLDENSTRFVWPWDVVVELAKMNKRLAYSELYRGITNLMRPTMVFYNHFLENETLTAIVFLPFTPKSVEYLEPMHFFCLNKVLEMKVNYDSVLSHPADLFKQKLVDLFYFVEDCEKLHGVTFCQSHIKACNNLASQFCANNMCKLCCQDLQFKTPCIIHDTYEQFFRYRIQSLYSFEEENNFDITRTIRILTRRKLKRVDLELIFSNLTVNWDRLTVFYHPLVHAINFVYLEFQDPQKAEQVFRDRKSYELKLESFDACIQSLNESLLRKAKQFPIPQHVLCIIKPLTTLEITDEIPPSEDYIPRISSLMENITQLRKQDILFQEDVNPLTKEPDDRHIYLTFPDKSYVDKVYHSQPFFGCLLVHKLGHRIICPFLRYSTEACLICSNNKNKKCLFDLCSECCGRQKVKGECGCSFNFGTRKEKAEKNEIVCSVCKEGGENGCPNKMCQSCCNSQCRRIKCRVHEESFFSRNFRKSPPEIMARRVITLVAECHIKLRNELKNGHYDWFRPVYNTNLQDSMIAANKELQTVIDNSNLIRGTNTSKFKKEGKIFTFQANEAIVSWLSGSEKLIESIDQKGEAYNDYYYGEESCREFKKNWLKNNPNKYRSYTIEEYEQYINAPNLQIRNSFHLMMLGLDKSLTVKELYQEVYSKIKANVGNIELKNMLILDNESIITDIFTSQAYLSLKNLEENLHKLGRVICIKFDNILDAIAIFVNEIKLSLPLNNGRLDQPIIYPSKYLIKFIDDFNPQNPPANNTTTGVAFGKQNEEIEHLNTNIRNLLGKTKNKRKLPNFNNGVKNFNKEESGPIKKMKK